MRTLVEITEERDETGPDGGPLYFRSNWYLLHWGLQMEIIETGDNKLAVGNRTVAICQNYDNGEVRCFMPEQCRILGQTIKT